MIIQEINATVNGNSLSGEVIVPSPVLTATKQAEDGNLTKSPNFQLKLTGVTPEMNIIDTVKVEFTNGDFNYTANMTVMNAQQNGTVTMQYVDGLTVEEAEEPTTPSFTYSGSDKNNPIICNVNLAGAGEFGPDPNSYPFTFTFSGPNDDTYMWDELHTWKCGNYELSMANSIRSDNNMYSILTNDGTLNNSTWICEDGGMWAGPMEAGEYLESWTLTFKYDSGYNTDPESSSETAQALDGTTLTFWVQFNVTDSGSGEPTVDPVLSQSINNILGSNYDVVNDMSEEDTLAATNNILYGEQS